MAVHVACAVAIVALSACGSAPARPAGEKAAARAPDPRACLRIPPAGKAVVPLARQGSAVALARVDERLIAFVAHRDAHRIDLVDVRAQSAIGVMPVVGSPEQVLVLGDGRLVVTLADRAAAQVLSIRDALDAVPVDAACLLPLPRGPSGLSSSGDDERIVVASTIDPVLSVLDARTFDEVRHVGIGRSPSAVLVIDGRAFVSHLVGDKVTVVDLEASSGARSIDLHLFAATEQAPPTALQAERHASQAYALVSVTLAPSRASSGGARPLLGPTGEDHSVVGRAPRRRVIVPGVSVAPGDAHTRTIYYGPPPTAGITKEMPVAFTIDADGERMRGNQLASMGLETRARECLLPRAAAVRESTGRLYVGCRGTDELLELDAASVDPMRAVARTFPLSKGVLGVAIADDDDLVVSFGEFEDALDVVHLADGRVDKVALGPPTEKLAASYVAGRELFFRTDDTRLAFDGVACASCHPDGREDGLTWSTPEGPRQTPMLAGRLHDTGPYGWTRGVGTLSGYIETTVDRLGGKGIDPSELAALSSFIERMPGPETSLAASPSADRGHRLFLGAGCAECHLDGDRTDKHAHALGGDSTAYDTPALRFIGLTAPYFHDGRYPTLQALLADPSNGMGLPDRISVQDRTDLSAYLETL